MAETEELPEAQEEAVDSGSQEALPGEEGSSRLLRLKLGIRFLQEKWRIVVPAFAGVLLVSGMAWFFTRDKGPTPAEQLQEALQLLDEPIDGPAELRPTFESSEIAKGLAKARYRDPDFPGATEFILGIAVFRSAQTDDDELTRNTKFRRAERLLQAAELGLPADRRPEWSYAKGVSLHQDGKFNQAMPHLQTAVEAFLEGKLDASYRLSDIFINLKTPEALKSALALNTETIETEELAKSQRDRAFLQRARIFLALGKNSSADEALGHVEQKETEDSATIVLRAQILMAKNKFSQAMELLGPVKNNTGFWPEFRRQAAYLTGECHFQRNDIDAAISAHLETARNYEESHEGVAANLRAASLLRQNRRSEEALKHYLKALTLAGKPEDYGNRWTGINAFRNEIVTAWNDWITVDSYAKHTYQEAIDLSNRMPPLFSKAEAYDFSARAHQYWAEHLERELQKISYSERLSRQPEIRVRWRQSGKAFAVLANELKASAKYPDKLWESAEQYRLGYDFESAKTQLTRFVNARPKQRLPLAIVRLGLVFMDLDRQDEALDQFRRVIVNYPTDHAAYEAKYLIGQCQLERNELKKAENAWREILDSENLTPAAREWRLSLFCLARLLFDSAEMLVSQAASLSADEATEETQKNLTLAFSQWDESYRLLEQYLKRYPKSPEALEGRFLLARALQHSAAQPRRKLQTAETENAKLELRRTIRTLLEEAVQQYRLLQQTLRNLEDSKQLGGLGERMLRDCYFEIAHTQFDLESYEESVKAYNVAANRYPLDPQVLLAYVQMANCYDHLKRPREAKLMLLQAEVILKGLPDDAFENRQTNLDKQGWKKWIEMARQLHQAVDPRNQTL